MITAALVLAIGLLLSAFFSGTETGFYRAPRVRLRIDAIGGDRIARGLLWASNHPEAFVSTALVGNNLANYLASSAIVTAAAIALPAAGVSGEVLLTLACAPLVFVVGELLPKRAFLVAPYGLLRRCAPMLFLAAIVLAVASSALWLASRALSLATGTTIRPLRMTLRRRELAEVFAEGHAVGLLSPAQRDLALGTFAVGGQPISELMTPVGRQPRLAPTATAADVLRLARRHQQDAWPIEGPPTGEDGSRRGFVRASRVLTTDPEAVGLPVEPLAEFAPSTPLLSVLTHLESHGQPLGLVLSVGGRVAGYVRLDRLQQALWDAA